jgi:Fe-S cluster assembly ATP-binding protein
VRAVVELVQDLRSRGTAFVVVSHYLQLIESLAPDAVLKLDQGCIAETGGMALARDIARTGFAHAHAPTREAVEA